MIDTHCHLDVPAFAADVDAVVARATAAGVIGMLVPAIRPSEWAALAALCAKHDAAGMRFAVGVHPQVVPDEDVGEELVERLVAAADGAVAIGECGLDGATGERARQEAIFRAHVRAARAVGKPLVVHVVRAHDVAPRILREECAHEVGGVMHSYSGGADLVRVYRELGMAFSFAGPVTYPNARKPLEAARAVPLELLMVERCAGSSARGRARRAVGARVRPARRRGPGRRHGRFRGGNRSRHDRKCAAGFPDLVS